MRESRFERPVALQGRKARNRVGGRGRHPHCGGLTFVLALLLCWIGVGAAAGGSSPALEIDGTIILAAIEPSVFAVTFDAGGHTITAIAFSLDLSSDLVLNPDDLDMDGIPDSVTFPSGVPELRSVTFDPDDQDGELDVLLANLSGTALPEGALIRVEVMPLVAAQLHSQLAFSTEPVASFGNDLGLDVPGSATVTQGIFHDGFESGDLSAWSGSRP